MRKTKKQKKNPLNPHFSNSIRGLFFLLVLLLPSQLGKHFFLDFSYISGVRVDYLAPTLYLTDVITIILFILHVPFLIKNISTRFMIGFLILLCATILSLHPILSTYTVLRFVQIYFLYLIARESRLSFKLLLAGFYIGGLGELILSAYQMTVKHSLQSIAYLFGERYFSLSTPDIAKVSLQGVELLRPYGTFSHPNSLAGFYLLLYAFVFVFVPFRKYPLLRTICLVLFSALVFFSFSKTAIVTLIFIVAFSFFKDRKNIDCTICVISRIVTCIVIGSIFLFAKSDIYTVEKRILLLKNAGAIIASHPFFGVGPGAYLKAQALFPSPYLNFFNQPVHTIFLLLPAEIGIVGSLTLLIVLFPFLRRFVSQYPLIVFILLMTGLFDHYWLTLHQNILLLSVVIGSLERRL